LFFCGNGGNVTHRAELLQKLRHQSEVSVLAVEYRGYGQSEGKPHEAQILADARLAQTWLAEREGIAKQDIVVMGESLGGAVAVDLAAGEGARGLVLASTFNRLPDVAAHYYHAIPIYLLMRTRFDSQSKIGNYHGPLLQFHGETDKIVPFKFGKQLFEAANEPKKFVAETKHDHNDSLPASFFAAFNEFLAGLPKTH
jgi:fermentation-respiration switch protein FrsA (DUF1100 family)